MNPGACCLDELELDSWQVPVAVS